MAYNYWSGCLERMDWLLQATFPRPRPPQSCHHPHMFSAGSEPNDMVESDDDDMKVPNDKPWENSPSEQRPPLYNAEDYAHYLRKLNKNQKNYLNLGQDGGKKGKGGSQDFRHPHLTSCNGEMSLKQFNTISELLKKLKQDLKQSFPSFIKEFVGHPNDGVSLLLDVLKMIQLSQTDQTHSAPSSKEQHALFLRTLQDEYECLVCLKQTMRCDDAPYRLVSYSHGLYTLAVCIMSNVNKSRVIAIELLTRAAETTSLGHQQVLEALSTLRLRVAEPVRFKFLVGMLLSYASPIFQVTCLRFLNKLLEHAREAKDRVFLQLEMEQAGFSCATLKKFLTPQHSHYSSFKEQLGIWDDNYIDVNQIMAQKDQIPDQNIAEIHKLTERNKKLEESENSLKGRYSEMKEKYTKLEEDYRNIKNQIQEKAVTLSDRSSQASTEGIREESETESGREMEKLVKPVIKEDKKTDSDSGLYGYGEKSPMVEEVLTVQNDTIILSAEPYRNAPVSKQQKMLSNYTLSEFYRNTTTEDDEETTIEDVVEELNNIASAGLANGIPKKGRRRGSITQLLEKHKKRENKEPFEDRHSPEGPVKEELVIVPTRVPKPPRKILESDYTTDVVYLSYDSPEETSDTESVISNRHEDHEGTFSSNRTVESTSCKSFGFIRPAVKRRETIMDPPRHYKSSVDVRAGGDKPTPIKRSESFQHVVNGSSHDAKCSSRKSDSPVRRQREDREYENLKGLQFSQGSKLSERFQQRMRNAPKGKTPKVKEERWNNEEDDWTIRWRYKKLPETSVNYNCKHSSQNNYKNSEAKKYHRKNSRNEEYQNRQDRKPKIVSRNNDRKNKKYVYDPEHYMEEHLFPNFVKQQNYHNGPKGWLRRGHGNAGLYSEYRLAEMASEDGDIQIPTPDYSHTLSPASTIDTVIRRDHQQRDSHSGVRMMDLPAGLY